MVDRIISDLESLELKCKSVSSVLRDTNFNSDRVSIICAIDFISSIKGIVGSMDTRMKGIVEQLPK